jgi:hypothetical protein
MNLLKTRCMCSLVTHKKASGGKLVAALDAALENAYKSWCVDIRALARQARELV